MKKLALLICITFLATANSYVKAQDDQFGNPERREEMKKRTEELKLKLKLSEPQSLKYDEILKRNREEARKKMSTLAPDAPRYERAEIMKNAMEKADQEITEILDSDQQAIYKAEKEKMKAERQEKRKERKAKK